MRLLPLAALVLGVGVFPGAGQPAQILLLRHAEKPPDDAALHLSARGEERAQALASFLGPGCRFTSNAPVAALYGTRATRHGHGVRTGETLAPLGQALGLPVQTPCAAESYAQLAADVLKNPAFRGRTVIICWTHHEIPGLAAALGVRPTPPAWKEKIFDRLWVIRPGPIGSMFQDLPQHLLRGDSKH